MSMIPKQMTLNELEEWMQSANYEGIAESEYDSHGNHFITLIYEKDGKLYSVDYCNNVPSEVWGDKGFIRGVYAPKEVTRHTEMIERVYYEPVIPQEKRRIK